MRSNAAMELVSRFLNKSELLSWMLHVHYVYFPFQSWIDHICMWLPPDRPWPTALLGEVYVTVAYTIASLVTNQHSRRKAIYVKTCLLVVILALLLALYPKIPWVVLGLFLEATIAGVFQASMYDKIPSVSTPGDSHTRHIQEAKLLGITLAGQLLIPRTLRFLGLTTHLSFQSVFEPSFEGQTDPTGHSKSIVIHSLLREALVLCLPSLFAHSKVRGWYQLSIAWFINLGLTVAELAPHALRNPGNSYRWYMRAIMSTQQRQRSVGQTVRLALLGKKQQWSALLPDSVENFSSAGRDAYVYIFSYGALSWILFMLWYYFIRR